MSITRSLHHALSWTFALALGLAGAAAAAGNAFAQAPAVRNGGFEEGGSPLPQAWEQDTKQTGDKGRVSVDRSTFHQGLAAVRLEPNRRNDSNQPLAIRQEIPPAGLRGKRIEVSGYVRTQGGAKATIAMLSMVGGKFGNLVTFNSAENSDWAAIGGTYDVADDPSVRVFLALWVTGGDGAAWFDDVAITLPDAPAAVGSAPAAATAGGPSIAASIEVDANAVVRRIPRTLFGTNMEWKWNGTAMWQEEQRRIDPKGLKLTQEMGVTLLRFPGGVFSDHYHWKEGIGPFERRPMVRHEPGKEERSRPNFGTDEALEFARQFGGELLITVNAGTGTAEEAAEWVRYVNAKELRVRFWEVGNELYIKNDSPMSRTTTVDPATYAARFREFARAMRAADPRIKVGAIGGENYGRYSFISYPNWDRIVLERVGDQMDFLAVHNAYAPVLTDDNVDFRTVYTSMLAAPVLFAQNLKTIANQIAEYVPGHGPRPFIAVTEWGPIFQYEHKGRYVDHPKTLGTAIFAASAMKALIESPQTEIANFWMLNDFSVLGWLGSLDGSFPPPRPDWAPTARYYAFQLYTRHFGEQLVRSQTNSPTFDSPGVGLTGPVKGAPYVEAISSLSADGKQLFVLVINKHFESSADATISVKGFAPAKSGTAWTLSGTSMDANTGTVVIRVPGINWGKQVEDPKGHRFNKGGPNEVTLAASPVEGLGASFTYRFAPHSVTSLVLTRR